MPPGSERIRIAATAAKTEMHAEIEAAPGRSSSAEDQHVAALRGANHHRNDGVTLPDHPNQKDLP